MPRVQAAIVLALLPCMAGAAVPGAGAKKNIVHGTVVSVQKADGSSAGSITVRLHAKKKQAASNATPVEKTFKLTAKTTFALVSGKKGAVQQSAADVSAVQAGSHVVLFHSGAEATSVKVMKKKGAKKNKNT